MRRTVALLAVVLAGCGGGDALGGGDARSVCRALEADDLTIADARAIYTSAVANGGPGLAGEMDIECPGLYAVAAGSVGQGPMAESVKVERLQCTDDEVTGRVTNNGAVAVDVTLAYTLRYGNVRAGDGLIFVDGLAPGETARFDEPVFDDQWNKCSVDIDSVLPA
jgi:hypothetical protein